MRRAACVVAFALLALTLSLFARQPGAEGAAAEPPATTQYIPELGLPATEVVAFGASPAEAPGEAWAYGYLGDVPPAGAPEQIHRYTLLERAADGTWTAVALPTGPAGQVAEQPGTFPGKLGALAGQSTPAGSVALLTDPGIVLRDPAGAPRLLPVPSGGELLGAGETLPPTAPPEGAPTPYAAYDPAAGKAGLLIAPYGDGAAGATPGPGVLDYDGVGWTREPIEAGGEAVGPLAIACGPTVAAPAADSGENCWLLATLGTAGGKLGLFRREPVPTGGTGAGGEVAATVSWAPVKVEGGLLGGGSGASLAPLTGNAQMLTATSQGVWVDFAATFSGEATRSASELVEPIAPIGVGAGPAAKVAGSWCFPTRAGCEDSLGAAFPAAYRSFAWPGASPVDPGRRIVTGFPDRGMLELGEGAFTLATGAGGSPGIAPGGAAFATPELGFVADGVDPDSAPDGAGQSGVIEVTTTAPTPGTATEPVPFRRPLTAVAMNPGGTGEALAVGVGGEIARFDPRFGWHQETLVMANTEAGPNLGYPGDVTESFLGVAWPAAERAYAVGEAGGIWTWSQATGVWAPIFSRSERPWNAVAFSSSDPARGFAVGDGAIDTLDLTGTAGSGGATAPVTSQPDTPPVFTSVAFAGEEAIATWHLTDTENGERRGGVSVESGSGWKTEPAVEELIDALPGPARWPTKVAGLPDGGAVVAGPGFVLERESPSGSWQFSAQPLPEAANVAALGAYRDAAGKLRAVVSIDLGPRRETTPTLGGSSKEPLPASGYLLRETATGWSDVEHAAFPVKAGSTEMPERPEPTLGLAVSADGGSILGVGGQTGTFDTVTEPKETEYETGAAIHAPASAAVEPDLTVPLPAAAPGTASFAIGGQAACAAACAGQAADGLGPDNLLAHAIAEVRELSATPNGPSAFLYTGGRLESKLEGAAAYEPELKRLATIFGTGAPLPVLTAPSPDMLGGGEALFTSAFAGYGPAPGGTPYYAYRVISPDGGTQLAVLTVDLVGGDLGGAQETWLRTELATARGEGVPAVVLGNAVPNLLLVDPPAGVLQPRVVLHPKLAEIMEEGKAAAYLFDYPSATILGSIAADLTGVGTPIIGTGTLGYGTPGSGAAANDWLGSSVFVLAEVAPSTNPEDPPGFSYRAIPNIETLTLHGRGQPRLATGEGEFFEGLGRVPAGGIQVGGEGSAPVFAGPEPYVTFPFPSKSLSCEGENCFFGVPIDYTFSSSEPQVGDFVELEGKLDAEGNLPSDPRSGFFCAKSPGTTLVTITAGGLAYSTPVEVTGEPTAGGCQPTLEATSTTEAAAPVTSEATQPPSPSTPPQTQPVPSPHGGVAPSPTPTHPHPTPSPSPPVPAPPAPVGTPAPTGPAPQAVNPVVSPHPPPGPQPAPPTGISSASQPVAQGAPGTQPAGQVANAPTPGVVPSPAAAPGQEREEQAAIQRQQLAVRSPVGARAGTPAGTAAGHGSGGVPLAALLLGPAALLALAGGIAIGAAGRGRQRAYASVARR